MPDEQHVVKPGGEVERVEAAARQLLLDRDLDAKRLARQTRGLSRAQARACQTGVEVYPQSREDGAGVTRLALALLRQLSLEIRAPVLGLAMAQKPDHRPQL